MIRLCPLLPSEDAEPYRLLEPFGVTPDSSGREVLDASFDMTPAQHADERLSRAWETLRATRTRLLVDFFLPDLPDEPAPSGQAGAVAPRLPVPFLRRLAEEWPELDVEARLDPPRVQWPGVSGIATGRSDDGQG